MKKRKFNLLLNNLDLRRIKHITVTPSFYDVLAKKYGSKWAQKHCSINIPKIKTIVIKKGETYVTDRAHHLLKKMSVDK